MAITIGTHHIWKFADCVVSLKSIPNVTDVDCPTTSLDTSGNSSNFMEEFSLVSPTGVDRQKHKPLGSFSLTIPI